MKKLLSLSLAALFALSVCAKPVDHSTAIRVAQNFAKSQVKMADYSATIVYTHTMPKSGQPAMYVVNVGNSAFVIVAADDVAHPVLGYSMSRPWPTVGAYPRVRPQDERQTGVQLPSQVSGFLDDLAAQIETGAQSSTNPDRDIAVEWQHLLSSEFNIQNSQLNLPDSVGPLLTTTWDQGQYYNALCPEDANGPAGHVWTGCVATAMAQIINYWGYPIHGRGTHSYQSDYGTLTVNYDSATYDYVNMPDALTNNSTPQEVQAVAKLMYDCGVAVNMQYSSTESGASSLDVVSAFVNHYVMDKKIGYTNSSYYTNEQWLNLIKSNIGNGFPVYYDGYLYEMLDISGRHAFVLDGYNSDDFVHINWGWGGNLDGWYVLGTSDGYNAIVNLHPDSLSNVLIGQSGGSVVYNVDSTIAFKHLYSNNVYPHREYIGGAGPQIITFQLQDTSERIMVDLLSYDIDLPWQKMMFYDGGDTSSQLIRVLDNHEGDYQSPVLASGNQITILYNCVQADVGFHLRIGKQGNCRVVSNVVVDETAGTKRISWTEMGNATQWMVEYGPENFVEGTGISYIVDTTSTVIYNIPSDTIYEVRVRPLCIENESNLWRSVTVNNRKYWTDVVLAVSEGFYIDSLNTIHISTAEGLAWMAKLAQNYEIANGIIIFENDIDLDGFLWRPIDMWNRNIDGNGHTISNMKVREYRVGGGLFSSIDCDTVKNLGFINADVKSRDAGTFAMQSGHAVFINCYSINHTVSSYEFSAGGFLANGSPTFVNCFAVGTIIPSFSGGGLFDDGAPQMYNCYTSVRDIIGVNVWKGLISSNTRGGEFENCFADIDYVKNTWTEIVNNDNMSYFFGNPGVITRIDNVVAFTKNRGNGAVLVVDTAINCSYQEGETLIDALNGWVIANNDSSLKMWVWDSILGLPTFGDHFVVTCPSVSDIEMDNIPFADSNAVAISWNENGTAGSWILKFLPEGAPDDSSVYFTAYTNHDTIQGLLNNVVYKVWVKPICDSTEPIVWNRSVSFRVQKPYWEQKVTSRPNGYVEDAIGNVDIYSAEGLVWLSVCSNGLNGQNVNNYQGKTVRVHQDLDLSNYRWRPISFASDVEILHAIDGDITTPVFRGTLNGLGHIISGIECKETDRVGLVGAAIDATISNITISNSRTECSLVAASLVSSANRCIINNCHSDGIVVGVSVVGGLIGGCSNNSVISNCSFTGSVYGDEYVGGLIGSGKNSSVTNCYENGTINDYGAIMNNGVARFIGMGENIVISNCYSAGAINGITWAYYGSLGSIIGRVESDCPLHNVYSLHSNDYGLWGGPFNCTLTDTSTFSIDGSLNTPISVNGISYTTLSGALNAWLDAYDTTGIYIHWTNDSLNQNDGFPVFVPQHYCLLAVDANDPQYGGVSGTGYYLKSDYVIIEAVPNNGYHFSHWNDGNTDNPRSIRITQDTFLTAVFEKNTYRVVGKTINASGYIFDFENSFLDSVWTIVNNDNYENKWYINTLEGSNRALFVSNTNGQSNWYRGGSTAFIFAYTTLDLEPGKYRYSYNWRCRAVYNTAYMRVALLPSNMEIKMSDWTDVSMSYNLPGEALPLDGGSQRQGYDTWTSYSDSLTINEYGEYKLLFFWRNTPSYISQPPAAVDNINFIRDSIMDFHNMGYVYGSDTVPYLDTVTLVAVPYEGYRFTGWSDGNTDNPRRIVATQNMVYIATFECRSYSIDDTVITCDSYSWNGNDYFSSAVLTDTFTTVNGCDSVITQHLTINNSVHTVTTETACETYTWNGTSYTASGNYTYNHTDNNGCTQVDTLHLTINNPVHTATTETACETYTWNGTSYTSSGNYTYSHADNNGCMQVDTLHLTINNPVHTATTETACETYTWNGTSYIINGNYIYSHADNNGCVQVDTLHLTINTPVHTAINETACETYTWNGTVYITSGNYTYSHADNNGCTQVDTLHLTINNPVHTATSETACETYSWNGTAYTTSGNYTYSHADANACTQVDTLHLTINNPVHMAITEMACETYSWNGTTYTTSGNYTYSHADNNGCMQVDTLHLTINNPVHTVITETACEIYTWNGTTYTTSGDYTYSHANNNGCTQVDTLHLTINNPIHTAITEVACETYTWNDSIYTTSGDYINSHVDANSCTQVDTLHLTINLDNAGVETITACNSFLWHGVEYTQSTNEPTYTSLNVNGCDSVTTLNLTINHCSTTEITACDSYLWMAGNGQTYTESGEYYHGTDTLQLTIRHSTEATIIQTLCDSLLWNGVVYYSTPLEDPMMTIVNSVGCDSVITLHLTINHSTLGDTMVVACESFTWWNTNYTNSTNDATHVLTNAVGCDSTVTLHLTINNPLHTATSETACEIYTWNGTVYTTSGNYTFSHADNNGCTQVDTLHLTINNPVHTVTSETACEIYTWNSTAYTTSGNYIYSHVDANGCTQVDTLHLTINNPIHTTIMEMACETYTWNGAVYTNSGDYTYSHADNNGCTQVDTLHLTIKNPVHTAATETVCDAYTWNSTVYMMSGDYTYTHLDNNGCAQVDTLHLTINNPVHTAITETACEAFVWNGTTYTSGGSYTYSHTDNNGCTQVDTLYLIINSPVAIEIYDTVCESYSWNNTDITASGGYVQTRMSAVTGGCDTTVTLHLTINNPIHTATTEAACETYAWNGTVYTTSGNYTYNHADVNGCMQVDTLYLVINHNNVGIETVEACNAFLWHGVEYTVSTSEPTFTSTNINGCDSVTILNLTINHCSTTIITACDSYVWITGSGLAYNESGVYYHETDTLRLTILNSTEGVDVQNACDSFTWWNTNYTNSTNEATHVLTNAAGCDSIVTLHLTINHSTVGDTSAIACESFTWQGTTYSVSGDVHGGTPLQNAAGCDSVVMLHLTINNPIHTAIVEVACETYTWNGTSYTASGNYTYNHTDNNGCTQVDTLHLTINNPVHTATTETACETYTWNGTSYTSSGNYTYSHADNNGCVQADTLHLTINNPVHTATTETACEIYTWNGTTYTTSGNYTYSHADNNGCTQVDTLHLTINNSTTGDTTAVACESFTWQGTTYSVSGDVHGGTPLQNAFGCDSVVTLHLTINNPAHIAITETACETYTWNGTSYIISGNYIYSHADNNGCVQVDTLHLTINTPVHTAINETACETYTWNGTVYTTSGNYTYSHADNNGCTQVDTLHLTINNPVHTATSETACETYSWNGTAYTTSGNYTYSHADANACTQVDTLHLTINNPVHMAITEMACKTYSWNGTTYTTSGNYTYSHADNNGCTQVDTLHLTIDSPVAIEIYDTVCDSYNWNGTDYTVSGEYVRTLPSTVLGGCDTTEMLHLIVNYSVVVYDSITIASTELPYDYLGNTIEAEGDYTFTGVTTEGCDSTMNLNVTVNQVGIGNVVDGTDVRVYPNPTDGVVTVEGRGVECVEVMDISGRVLIDQKCKGSTDCRIDISMFRQGAYLLRVTTVEGVSIRKVVKQ